MIDRLLERIDALNNPTVAGLDPTLDMMPEHIRAEMFERHGRTPRAVAEMFISFNRAIIDALKGVVPAVKPQIAMYERYGLEGVRAYLETAEYASANGFFVIGDIKRGDISSTAEAYAAHIGGTDIGGCAFDLWHEDAITVNPYLGSDGIEPFIKAAAGSGRGIFVLVKTSNPSSSEIQDRLVDTRPLYEHVGALVAQWGEGLMGARGYSSVGAVVGATHPEEGRRLRQLLRHTFFLVPGYGAQGGTAEDLKAFFDEDRRGCIVNSSRGIIAAYRKDKRYAPEDFASAAREAALDMKRDMGY